MDKDYNKWKFKLMTCLVKVCPLSRQKPLFETNQLVTLLVMSGYETFLSYSLHVLQTKLCNQYKHNLDYNEIHIVVR